MTRAVAPQAQRFYPAKIEPFAFEPLRSDFAIKPAGAKLGEGLVALRDFAAGEVVFVFTGEIVLEVTQYTLQLDTQWHIHDPHVMGKVLHHCTPNCHVDIGQRTFIAIRPIAAGDYVTMDYCQTEDVLFKPFTCSCGAPDCRGFINGKRLDAESLLQGVLAEARRRISTLVRSASRYENLARIAAISQELGNMLSDRIYAASTQSAERALACNYGCATCCQIPLTVPQVTTTDFTMTVLDVITLIENRGTLKSGNSDIPALAIADVLPAASCPQLTSTGTCSIYECRPVTCKIWFSANLDLCVRNKERGYKAGVNPMTDESDRLRSAFEEPFAHYVAELAPDLAFRGHDFLSVFRMVSILGRDDLTKGFRDNIDAGLPVAEAFEGAQSR